MKIYTRTGDQGQTKLVTGNQVSKADIRLDSYGTVDELNSCLGVLRASMAQIKKSKNKTKIAAIDLRLFEIQNHLFNLGSQLACDDEKIWTKLPKIDEHHVRALELDIDFMTEKLPPLNQFILPGGGVASAQAHVARTVCRRAERLTVQLQSDQSVPALAVVYLNRLSDYFFVLARWLNFLEGFKDQVWQADLTAHAQMPIKKSAKNSKQKNRPRGATRK